MSYFFLSFIVLNCALIGQFDTEEGRKKERKKEKSFFHFYLFTFVFWGVLLSNRRLGSRFFSLPPHLSLYTWTWSDLTIVLNFSFSFCI